MKCQKREFYKCLRKDFLFLFRNIHILLSANIVDSLSLSKKRKKNLVDRNTLGIMLERLMISTVNSKGEVGGEILSISPFYLLHRCQNGREPPSWHQLEMHNL